MTLVQEEDPQDKSLFYSLFDTEWGKLAVASNCKDQILAVHFGREESCLLDLIQSDWGNRKLVSASCELHMRVKDFIFERNGDHFELAVKTNKFNFKVWQHLLQIEYGLTISYSMLAKKLDCPNGQRAVGQAVGKNPISFLIPCHRVVATNRKITGFRWGRELKLKMLSRESGTLFA